MKRVALVVIVAALGCDSRVEQALQTERAYPCTFGNDAECPSGMICGREKTCRNAEQTGPWQCVDDNDCHPDKGWLCDTFSQKCADAAKERLTTPAATLTGARTSPAFTSMPRLIAMSKYFDTTLTSPPEVAGAACQSSSAWSWVDEDELHAAQFVCKPLNVDSPRQHAVVSTSVPLRSADTRAIVSGGDGIVYVADDIGMWRFDPKATPQAAAIPSPVESPKALRHSIGAETTADFPGVPEEVWAWNDHQFGWYDVTTGIKQGPFTLPFSGPDGGVPTIRSIVLTDNDSVIDSYDFPLQVYAITDVGIFIAYRSSTGFLVETATQITWTPLQLPGIPNTACDGGAPTPIGLVTAKESRFGMLAVGMTVGDPSDPNPVVRSFEVSDPLLPAARCSDADLGEVAPPLRLCPDGGTLRSFEISSNFGDPLTSSCAMPDGGTTTFRNSYYDDYEPISYGWRFYPAFTPAFTAATSDFSNVNVYGFIDETGRPFSSNSSESPAAETVFPLVAPYGVAGGGRNVLLAESSVTVGTGNFARSRARSYSFQSGAGLIELPLFTDRVPDYQPPLAGICGSLEGADGLVLHSPVPHVGTEGELDIPKSGDPALLISRIGDLYDSFERPLAFVRETSGLRVTPCGPDLRRLQPAGSALARPDAGVLVAVAAGDTIFAGTLSAQSGLEGLKPVLAPRSRFDIDDFVLLRPPVDPFPKVAGYALVANHVYQFDSAGDTRWSHEEIPLPEGNAVELWEESGVARVGFDDGRVVSLPSRVALSNPLSSPVREYGTACGRAFALTAQGLFSLQPPADDGLFVGSWSPVEIDWRLAPGFKPRLGEGRLHSSATALYVFDENGMMAEVRPGCD